MEERQQLRVLVRGRVQGVFFRKNAKKVADNFCIKGYAKNLPSGEVEIVGEGDTASLQDFLDWCYRGSRLSEVRGLSFEWNSFTGAYKKFSIDREGNNIVKDKLSALENLSKNLFDVSCSNVPNHIVIIPDGNRRWARENHLSVWKGHEKAFKNTITYLIKEARELGVTHLTMWGFSTENWSRDKKEVQHLMRIFKDGIVSLRKDAFEHNICMRHFGRKDRLPKGLVRDIEKLESDTGHFTKYNFAIALDYGGRDELLRACKKIEEGNKKFSEEEMTRALDTNGFPDPDLIIRTSGEKRLSGMMPWQGVYSELHFSPVHFPEFGPQELRYAVADYANRKRRYGK